MNVLIVSDTFAPDINGVARTLEVLAQKLAGLGHQVEVVTTTDETWEEQAHRGVHVRRVLSMRMPGYREVRAGLVTAGWFARLIRIIKPDVMYVAVESLMGMSAVRAARKCGVPVVSGFHTNFHSYADHYRVPFMKQIAARFMRWFHNRTKRTLAPSRDTVEQLEALGVTNAAVLGRGVNLELFSPSKRDARLRAEWGADDESPVVLFVGRIAVEKNLPLAVKAMQRAMEIHPKARGVFVGGGPKEAWLRKRDPQMLHAGAMRGEELARHYASADVFLFTTLTETYGNVLPEAMASGLSSLSFHYAAARELVVHRHNGFSVPRGDEAAFLAMVDEALARWNDRTLRTAAREATEHLSWDAITAQFERELKSACRESAVPAKVRAAGLLVTS